MPQAQSFESDRDPALAAPPTARAGLRVASRDQPPGTFVAIEIAVLVFVIALAMVAIIVIGSEDTQRAGASASLPHAAASAFAHRPSPAADGADGLGPRRAR